MKAVTWQGKQKMEIRNVEDPKILRTHRCDYPYHRYSNLRLRSASLSSW